MRGLVAGAIAISAVYLVPVTGRAVLVLANNLPIPLGVHEEFVFAIKLALACSLWLTILLLSRIVKSPPDLKS